MIDLASLQTQLADLPLGQIEYYPTIGSTNTRALELAEQGAPDLTLVVADEQTAGRGRAGRRWFTPPDSALAFSLLLRPDAALQNGLVGRMAGLGALAVSTALEEKYQLAGQIKWPNDVLLDGKKVCGILVETHWLGEQLQAIVIGIGVNVLAGAVPPRRELRFPATAVQTEVGRPVDRLALLVAILAQLVHWKGQVSEPAFMQAWEQRLAFLGQTVQLLTDETLALEGVLHGLDPTGGLVLSLPNQEQVVVQAGEIHLRPAVDTGPN